MRRVRGRVEGTVQGVGFRPYVHRLASELHLGGTVGNDERGVVVEVEGRPDDVAAFLARQPVDVRAKADALDGALHPRGRAQGHDSTSSRST